MTLDGKVALVTGAAQGMGAAIARCLAQHGARVVATDIAAEPAGYAADFAPGRLCWKSLDVRRAEDWARVIDEVHGELGGVDVLVNNAGIAWFADLEGSPEDDVRRMIDVDQMGVFLGMQAVVPGMKRAGGGSIVNIASVASLKGTEGLLAYSACKWAVRGMTKCAALELGRFGIRVNAVHPGMIDTPMTTDMEEPTHLPIPRKGSADEVARTVLFLASGTSSYSTGGDYIVDGGMTIPSF